MKSKRDRPETGVVITPQMIEAGASRYAEMCGWAEASFAAREIYEAMCRADNGAAGSRDSDSPKALAHSDGLS